MRRRIWSVLARATKANMVTVKLFTRFGALVKQENLALIVVPEVIQYGDRHYVRDYAQGYESWQRYTEAATHVMNEEQKP